MDQNGGSANAMDVETYKAIVERESLEKLDKATLFSMELKETADNTIYSTDSISPEYQKKYFSDQPDLTAFAMKSKAAIELLRKIQCNALQEQRNLDLSGSFFEL